MGTENARWRSAAAFPRVGEGGPQRISSPDDALQGLHDAIVLTADPAHLWHSEHTLQAAMADRSQDWLAQARADLLQADLSAANGHHEWACFAAHQAVEKALKGLHLSQGQQAWGHGLGRLFRDLPAGTRASLAATISDLADRLRVLDALYIPTRYPDSLPDGAPADHFGRLQSADALSHARSLVDAIGAALAGSRPGDPGDPALG